MPKQKSLNDISRDLPSAESIESWFRTTENLADRECAIAYVALIDAFLERAIALGFIVRSQSEYNELFRDPGALFNALSSKVLIASAVGVIFPEMQKQLNVIRRIRNAFGHAVQHLDFSNDVITRESRKLDCQSMAVPGLKIQDAKDNARGRFEETCQMIACHLLYYLDGVRQAKSNGNWIGPLTFQSKYAGPNLPDPQSQGANRKGQSGRPPPSPK